MHPIVIISFTFAFLGGAYWVLNNPALAKSIGLGAANSVWASYGNLAIKILFVGAMIYAAWLVWEFVRNSSLKKKAGKNVEKFN